MRRLLYLIAPSPRTIPQPPAGGSSLYWGALGLLPHLPTIVSVHCAIRRISPMMVGRWKPTKSALSGKPEPEKSTPQRRSGGKPPKRPCVKGAVTRSVTEGLCGTIYNNVLHLRRIRIILREPPTNAPFIIPCRPLAPHNPSAAAAAAPFTGGRWGCCHICPPLYRYI